MFGRSPVVQWQIFCTVYFFFPTSMNFQSQTSPSCPLLSRVKGHVRSSQLPSLSPVCCQSSLRTVGSFSKSQRGAQVDLSFKNLPFSCQRHHRQTSWFSSLLQSVLVAPPTAFHVVKILSLMQEVVFHSSQTCWHCSSGCCCCCCFFTRLRTDQIIEYFMFIFFL